MQDLMASTQMQDLMASTVNLAVNRMSYKAKLYSVSDITFSENSAVKCDVIWS